MIQKSSGFDVSQTEKKSRNQDLKHGIIIGSFTQSAVENNVFNQMFEHSMLNGPTKATAC